MIWSDGGEDNHSNSDNLHVTTGKTEHKGTTYTIMRTEIERGQKFQTTEKSMSHEDLMTRNCSLEGF